MPTLRLTLMLLALPGLFSGCTLLERSAHLYSGSAPEAQVFHYRDGGSALYYTFELGDKDAADTLLFFYGGTGCPSWKSVMPDYVRGLGMNARVFALNKRFVADRSLGLLDCGDAFQQANNPQQWIADHGEFIQAQLAAQPQPPRHVVLVGVSEGALPAARLARQLPQVTHLAIIGSGAFSLRQSLRVLKQKGATRFDIDEAWPRIAAQPRSLTDSWYGNPYRWWSDVADLEPATDLLPLDIPILLGIGEQDQSVPVESAQALQTAFSAAGKRNLTLRIYPAADHRLNTATHAHRDEFFAELGRLLESRTPATPDIATSSPMATTTHHGRVLQP